MEAKLNIQNPDAISYQTEEILYTILGGIRLEGLGRLRGHYQGRSSKPKVIGTT